MFPKKEKPMAFAAGSTTLISKATEIVGDLHFKGNLEIEGRVKGNIIAEDGSDARVRVMDGGEVEGEIRAPSIVVNGKVSGNVHSSKHIELAEKAIVQGNVSYHLIEMVKGAQVNGSLLYSDGKQAVLTAVESSKDHAVEA
ncbi:bactofilin family protein [Pseudoteredinibacter isoporae]|uniref:Cytoskeletal protein CcmA (Bactofilin family) n=1 Tax=Pseudoteredinibacter isoporae TaxID=570281 RepID=A0A7X0JPA3_9GAMM|nr:polymer-forming cytoskeletal protein [Pseudoteredinibacter isoporae]MBB6519727.1 cytoskeletal protein CcmA (bactofilin family) [Pseudoteredinibacter isoporae]NHO85308.1 polymer-forming cytoskeletal protein [Pseudoteredinibacter isoporae]NIB26240.1 polymer-forming cytoskeletal protein [Pseudoteredinibacter isoporae]